MDPAYTIQRRDGLYYASRGTYQKTARFFTKAQVVAILSGRGEDYRVEHVVQGFELRPICIFNADDFYVDAQKKEKV